MQTKRKIVFKFILSVYILSTNLTLSGQTYQLANNFFKIDFNKDGSIKEFFDVSDKNKKQIEFRKDSLYIGPSILVSGKRIGLSHDNSSDDTIRFKGKTDQIELIQSYSFSSNALGITIKVKNKTEQTIPIESISLRLGVNLEQDFYPHWNNIYFPTLMRCEKDYFWGYLMNPAGEILVLTSPNAIASWHNNYKNGDHRIFTTCVDLMHEKPLPERHPQNLHSLAPNEEKTWTIYIEKSSELNQVKPIVNKNCNVPVVDASLYTIGEGEKFDIKILGEVKNALMVPPDGKEEAVYFSDYSLQYTPKKGVGKYKLIVTGTSGKQTEAIFSVRQPWSWYLQQARINALKQEQKASSHTENWYGLFSMFLAQKYNPDSVLFKKTMHKFNEIYPLMYQPNGRPIKNGEENRIQNTSCMASVMAAIYDVTKDTNYLVKAANMCDFLMEKQATSGAYKNGNTHYTSVIYIAKSIMEVMEYEKKLSTNNIIWKERYEKHKSSVKKAIDELALSRDNIQTEGEMTYEDGMISCSYTQLSFYALKEADSSSRSKYMEAADYLLKGHRCLSQLLIPDSRMNGGSLRYWESQYDILSFKNIMSSPHGWSAWQIYGLWYMYQLTGNPDLIQQVYNALGSCVQLIDENTGKLRWGFCVDPYLKNSMLIRDKNVSIRENRGLRVDTIIGEQYINMISNWYKAKSNTWVSGYWKPDGGCCDNDVHEIFKCLEEVAIKNSCVVVFPNGSIKSYNCNAEIKEGKLIISPYEKMIAAININNLSEKQIQCIIKKENKIKEKIIKEKMISTVDI